jgi:hypothetical protein
VIMHRAFMELFQTVIPSVGWDPTLFKSLISILVVIRVELNIGHVPHFSPTTQTTRPCVKLQKPPRAVTSLFSFHFQANNIKLSLN